MSKRYVIVTQVELESEGSKGIYESCDINTFDDPLLAIDFCVDQLLCNAIDSLLRVRERHYPKYRYEDDSCELYVIIDGETLDDYRTGRSEAATKELVEFNKAIKKAKEEKLLAITTEIKEYALLQTQRDKEARRRRFLELRAEFENET